MIKKSKESRRQRLPSMLTGRMSLCKNERINKSNQVFPATEKVIIISNQAAVMS